jgi:hypothetical protein
MAVTTCWVILAKVGWSRAIVEDLGALSTAIPVNAGPKAVTVLSPADGVSTNKPASS